MKPFGYSATLGTCLFCAFANPAIAIDLLYDFEGDTWKRTSRFI